MEIHGDYEPDHNHCLTFVTLMQHLPDNSMDLKTTLSLSKGAADYGALTSHASQDLQGASLLAPGNVSGAYTAPGHLGSSDDLNQSSSNLLGGSFSSYASKCSSNHTQESYVPLTSNTASTLTLLSRARTPYGTCQPHQEVGVSLKRSCRQTDCCL